MRIVSILENQKIEKRIAITPEIAKKYLGLGFEVTIVEKYGEHLGFKDSDYKELLSLLWVFNYIFDVIFKVNFAKYFINLIW